MSPASALTVRVPAAVLAAATTVQVGLCEGERCGHVVLPVSGHADGVRREGSTFRIGLDGFHTIYDTGHRVSAVVILLGGPGQGGAALVRQDFDFTFTSTGGHPKACDPAVLSHAVVVTAGQAP